MDEKHPLYGPCNGLGPTGSCSVCTGLIERLDGSVVKDDGSGEIVKLPPLLTRLRWAWSIILRGYVDASK